MPQSIAGKRVTILPTHGFEQSELTEPQRALKETGAIVHVASPEAGTIRGFKHLDPGGDIAVDRPLAEAKPGDYDALVLPGGLFNPDQLLVRACRAL